MSWIPPRGASSASSTRRRRAGDYRIAAAIEDEILRILVVRVGHRREIYRR
ncbi:MAG: type II toxin-antitoxin system RelE/ParE family toxin [Albidovulum sp.]|nr:type II toxin-antitoxin system RelE/ParE family toxin [Albidovulum sp.]